MQVIKDNTWHRAIILMLILLSLLNTSVVNNMIVGAVNSNNNKCVFALAATSWYIQLNNYTISDNISVSLKYRMYSIDINLNTSNTEWKLIRGYFANNTSIIYGENGEKISRKYNYSGNLSGIMNSLIEDSSALFANGIYSRNISLKPNETLVYNLLNNTINLWTPTRQRLLLVDFRIRATSTPLIALGVSVNASNGNYSYSVTYYADSIHRELLIPVNARGIILNGSSSISMVNVTIRAYYNFRGVVDLVLYVIEFPQPVLDVRMDHSKIECRPYVFIPQALASRMIATIVQEYYSKITSPPSKTFGLLREGDELLYDYTYNIEAKIIDKNLLNKSRLNYLIQVFRSLFNSTIIKMSWSTSIQYEVNSVIGGLVNYILRILHLTSKYSPKPLREASKPLCGDGLLGVCPILWLDKLRGTDSTISKALTVLPPPGITAVSSVEWLYLPWATDVAFPGYQATPENLIVKPLLFSRVYLGYPFASLTPLPGAVWFTGNGVIENSSYGLYGNIPVVGLAFRGKDYQGYFYIDSFYLNPVRAFFKGSPSSWSRIGIEYNVYYNLRLFRWRGWWRNLTTTIIPVKIASRSSSVELLLVVTQPGSREVKVRVENKTLVLNIVPGEPLRIIILGKGKPYDVTGAYWLALPLVSNLDLVYPTTLVYISEENPQTYNFIASFPIITLSSPKLRLLVLNGDKWLIENVSVGKPGILNNKISLPVIQLITTSRSANTTKPTTTTTTEEGENRIGYYTNTYLRLIAGITVFIITIIIVLAYKKTRGEA